MKRNNICILGTPEEENEQGIQNIFEEIINKNFPTLVREKDTLVQEVHRVPNKMDPKEAYTETDHN